MILCYNLTRQQPVDLDNCRINTKPLLFFGERPMWELHFFQGEPGTAGTVADLSNVVSLRAAVDTDWNGNTVPMCRTVDGIDKSRAAEGVMPVGGDRGGVGGKGSFQHKRRSAVQLRPQYIRSRSRLARGIVLLRYNDNEKNLRGSA